MNNKNYIKLANLTIEKGGFVNPKIENLVLTKLSRKDISRFLRALKKVISDNFVLVFYSEKLPENVKHSLKMKYNNMNILYKETEEVENGIRIMHKDTLIDLSFNGYVRNVLEKLKSYE